MNWILLAAGSTGQQQGPSAFSYMFLLLGMLAIFYFLLIRPQQKKQRELQKMIEALTKGDRVMTSGGIFGTVVGFKDNILVLRIAEDVKIEILKSSVANVVERSG